MDRYTPVLGNCSLHCSTPKRRTACLPDLCIPAVVRALLPAQRAKILLS